MNWLNQLEPLIGPAPTEGGVSAARAYHRKMVAVLKTTPAIVSGDLRRALMKRERRWRRRACGEDKRWNAVGARAGRLPRYLEQEVSPLDLEYAKPIGADGE